jgi:gluconate 2-dehydrogenase subunit 3-like protein
MSEITRREALGQLAAAFAAAAIIEPLAAETAHAAVQQATAAAGGTYAPKALSPDQFRTLSSVTDLIIPVDNGKPGALQAGVPAWIDMLLNVNEELKDKYVKGIAWLDSTMTARHGTEFATSTPAQQTALLDTIAFKKNRTPELDPGIDFFILLRRMTVDGFYTSEIGMRDIYPGNTARTEFTVPQAAIDYVLNRSPFKQ